METITKQIKWLITGGNGQVARVLAKKLSHLNIDYIALSRAELDITDINQLQEAVELNKPGVLVNTASWTNVDLAETNEFEVFRVNELGAKNVSRVCSGLNIQLIQLSTDYVFSGKQKGEPYSTADHRDGISKYGVSKIGAEDAVIQFGPKNAKIIRTSWLYSEEGKNFYKTILRKLSSHEELKIVNDQRGTPTNVHHLADKLVFIATRMDDEGGIFHITNRGEATWYDFAQEIAILNGFDPSSITPINTSELIGAAPRPQYSILEQFNWEDWGAENMKDWKTGLREFCESYPRLTI